MQTRAISQDGLTECLKGLLVDHQVMAPVEVEPGFLRFEVVDSAEDVVLDYVTTILPPKQAMFPQRQPLFRYTVEGPDGKPEFEPVVDETPKVVVGVHPCDLAGIGMLDWAFERDHRDELYMAQREATTLIGVDCHPDEHCFCTAVDTAAPKQGYDLFLTPIGGGYLVSVGTEKGQKLLDTFAETREATPEDLAAAGRWQDEKKEEVSKKFDAEVYNLPLTFQQGVSSPSWTEEADPCLSCGSCNLVCPTCFCFDVEDLVDLDGKGGVRERSWDGCQLTEFAKVAGGESFRPKPEQRLRHRFYRKYDYLMTLYGSPFCTGCGRCGRACPVDINIVDTINALVANGRKEGKVNV